MAAPQSSSPSERWFFVPHHLRRYLAISTITLFAALLLAVYLSPFVYMVSTALKDSNQFTDPFAPPLWPATPANYTHSGSKVTYTFTFNEKEESVALSPGDTFDLYQVTTEDGATHEWALIVKRRGVSFFINPNYPQGGLIEWGGEWRTLRPAYYFNPNVGVFAEVWEGAINFPRVFRNTFIIALGGDIGTLISCTLVAYGFSRFRIPGKNILLLVLISTIILPGQVTLIPTYAVFARIGWVGTFLPLIVPHFFANAFNVFLLRQFFMTIPKEMDEAAMIDGAGPFRTLVSVILPQAVPALITVVMFHFLFAWNDYFTPLLYLTTRPELQPISVALQIYNQQYAYKPTLIQASSLIAMVIPLILFFLGQRIFMRSVIVHTGVEK